jgi:hypothetical protein
MPIGALSPISSLESAPAIRDSGQSAASNKDRERLKQDLETGEWQRRYGELVTLDTMTRAVCSF